MNSVARATNPRDLCLEDRRILHRIQVSPPPDPRVVSPIPRVALGASQRAPSTCDADTALCGAVIDLDLFDVPWSLEPQELLVVLCQ